MVSPSRPPQSRAGSPAELAIPQLNDNVDEELNAVRNTLANVGHTHTFRNTRPSLGIRPDPEGDDQPEQADHPEQAVQQDEAVGEDAVGEAEVLEGQVVAPPENLKVGADNAGGDNEDENGGEDDNANMVDFDQQNTDDGDKANELARSIRVEFNPVDVRFWFSELEAEMLTANINKQWLKKRSFKGTCLLNKRRTSKHY